MFLNIRLLIVALVISSATIAQETRDTENPESEIEETNESGKEIGSIVIGPYLPISFGDNFVNNGMDLKMGARISFKVNAYQGFYIGPYFSFFKAWNNNTELLGNYYKSTNTVVGGILGYEKHINKFDISLGVGIGASIYHSNGPGINFDDTATSVWLNPEVSYRFSPFFGVYFAPELRHDFMNIDVPSELKDTFNGVNYLNLSFGLRINLGTAYKNL